MISQVSVQLEKSSDERILIPWFGDTDDEVNATQKGLDNSGVRMPNFGGIGKALSKTIPEEVEPESEEQCTLVCASFAWLELNHCSTLIRSRSKATGSGRIDHPFASAKSRSTCSTKIRC